MSAGMAEVIAFAGKGSKIQKKIEKKGGDDIEEERVKGYFVNKAIVLVVQCCLHFDIFFPFNIFLMFSF